MLPKQSQRFRGPRITEQDQQELILNDVSITVEWNPEEGVVAVNLGTMDITSNLSELTLEAIWEEIENEEWER